MAKKQLNGIGVGVGRIRYSVLGEEEYGIPVDLGDLISFTITPSENITDYWAGDRRNILDSTITASGTFVVPAISNADMATLFGLEVGVKGELIYKSTLAKPTVALFIEQNNHGGVTDYISIWECKLQLNTKSGSTRTESIAPSTTEIAFDVIIPRDKRWMTVLSSDEIGFQAPDFNAKPVKPTVRVERASVLKTDKA